ncbi:MAG TPA: sulfatase-like hydrolase/transferase [Vicinamibacteria bacterium]|nr:sulfatase-like hydrolase/transferase [Vicinamibacteria bacterium]
MRRLWLLLLVLAVMSAAGAILIARRPALRPAWLGGAPRNLLIVTLDTLRADHVGSYGYVAARTPRLDGLAARGLRFERATTVTPLTLPAHSSLLTGTFPAFHGVRDNGGFYLGDEQVTLAEVLKERGFRTGGFVSAFVLDSRWGIAQGFDRFFDEFDFSKFEKAAGMDAIQRPGRETVDAALAWLAEDRRKPFFAWVHLYDPHTPYTAPPEQAALFPRGLLGAYDAEIAEADTQLGRLLDALEGDGRLGSTLVAVLGDHGEMLGEHGEATHGFFVYDAAVRIPMVLAGPAVPERVVKDQVRIVDVMPTALELLRVPLPAAVQGASLMPLARGERLALKAVAESWYPRFHYGWSELVTIQDERFKLIRAPRPELYDVQRDPGERSDLAAAEGRQVEVLRGALEEMLARLGSGRPVAGPQAMDAETAERLQALGYVGGTISARHLEERPRGDPKDKIELYNLLKRATGASAEGRTDEALSSVRSVLEQDPEVLEGHMLLGNFLSKAGKHAEAVGAYKKALSLDPEHHESLFRLALAYKELGRPADARVGFERAQQLDPRNMRITLQLADLDMREKHFEAAETRLQKAIGEQEEPQRLLLKLGECYLETKRWEEAEKALRDAIARDPKLETAHFNLGLALEERRDVVAAQAAYAKEIEENPKAYRAAFNLGRLLQRSGRQREALERFRQVVPLAPDFAIGRLYLAKALLDAGELAEAEREARAGLALRPENNLAPLGHFVLADVYNRQGRVKEARAEQAAGERLVRAGPAAVARR